MDSKANYSFVSGASRTVSAPCESVRLTTDGLSGDALKLMQQQIDHFVATADPQDWVYDFKFENGIYINLCLECERTFKGHKRRVMCRLCASA